MKPNFGAQFFGAQRNRSLARLNNLCVRQISQHHIEAALQELFYTNFYS